LLHEALERYHQIANDGHLIG